MAVGVITLWLLVYIYYETDQLHRWLGYALTAIVAMRMLAGVLTQSVAARLVWPSWPALNQHLQHLKQRSLPVQHGHNPLGMLAVYWLWGCILLLALTGWLSRTDALWGEDWPVDLHAGLSYVLMASVLLHVIAVLVMSRLARQHLLRQMLHGKLSTFGTQLKKSNHSQNSEA